MPVISLPSPFPVVLLLGLVLAVACPAPAVAEISGASPDESAAQAYGPLRQGVTYSGAFASPNDIDYLSFVVADAGETLDFSVQNTTQVCHDPNDAGCPVYATLMDSTGANQLGGDSSAAGTIATYGDTEIFSWTFAEPGTYYVLMESNGDLSAGSPAYAVSVSPASASGSSGTSGGTGPTGANPPGGAAGPAPPIVRSLKVPPHQRGKAVTAKLVLGQLVARLRAQLVLTRAHGRPRSITVLTLRDLRVGAHRLTVRLPASYRHKLALGSKLSLRLKITVFTPTGLQRVYTRPVTLRR